MISILDYGAGNLRSVQNTLDAIGSDHELVTNADGLRRASRILLPGVGHFGQMMRALDAMQVRETLIERIRAGVPFLGICLGLQALFDASEEAPEMGGLGLFDGTVRRFGDGLRVPHMGWNEIVPRNGAKLLAGMPEHPYLYFANSYYAPLHRATAATCEYGVPFTAALEEGNIFGLQFHPEKSGPLGLRIVRNFAEL